MGAIDALLLQARLLWDGEAAEQGMDNAGKQADNLESKIGKAFKKVGGYIAAAFTVDAIKNFAVDCIDAGAEVSAETAAFGQIMGDYADEASAKMGKVADATGMVDTRLTPYMTSMTAKFKGLGYGVDDATDMASRGLTLAADSAAFWDKSLDESMSHLNSFINGSYEGGEAIGLFANDTQMAAYAVEQGIVKDTKAWSSLDEATKQATRLEYAENMMKQSGATGQAAKESGAYANTMANLAEKWRQFKAQIGEPLIQNVVTPAVGLLSKGIDKLSQVVDYVKENFESWKPYIIGVAQAMGVLAAAFVGFKVGTAISKGIKLIKSGELVTKAWTAAQKIFNLVMNANPIGLVVMAIAALVAAFVIAYNKSETFRNLVNRLWASIKQLWAAIVEGVKSVLTQMAPVLDAIKSLWSIAWTNIKTVAATIWANIKTVVYTAINVIRGIIDTVTAIIKGDWSGAWNAIKGVASTIWNGIKSVVSNTINAVKSVISNTLGGIKSTWTNLWEGIKNAASEKLEGAKKKIKSIIDTVKGFFNFKISWPNIPTPHFGISPKGWKVGDLLQGSIPKLSIDWYAKAMDKAAVLDGATIFGASNGRLLGGGENGREVVSGEAHLIGLINQAVAQNNEALLEVLRRILDAIKYLDANLYDTIVEALSDGVRMKWDNREIGRMVKAHA